VWRVLLSSLSVVLVAINACVRSRLTQEDSFVQEERHSGSDGSNEGQGGRPASVPTSFL